MESEGVREWTSSEGRRTTELVYDLWFMGGWIGLYGQIYLVVVRKFQLMVIVSREAI